MLATTLKGAMVLAMVSNALTYVGTPGGEHEPLVQEEGRVFHYTVEIETGDDNEIVIYWM